TDGNPGVTSAGAAALAVGGEVVVPQFADEAGRQAKHAANGHKLSDFNDLHVLEGLHVVRVQIEARLSALRWAAAASGAPTTISGAGERLTPTQTTAELLDRYALVYAHSGAVFDRREHILMSLSDMRDACVHKYIHRAWAESADPQIVRIREVGFDPSGQKPGSPSTRFAGGPPNPSAASCDGWPAPRP